MASGSGDKTVRRWDIQTGKETEELRNVCEEVWALAVSSDGRQIITAGGQRYSSDPGELKACDVETGMIKIFDGHVGIVTCIDVSMDGKLLASGL
jgi:WD40 repeat protein